MKKGIVLLAMLLSSANSLAVNRPGAFTLTPGMGYYFFADKRHLHDTAVLPTVALAYNFDEHWAVEGNYGTFSTGARPSGSVKGNIYGFDGIYRCALHGSIQPYILAGLGVTYLNPNGTDAGNEANLNAGVGAQMFFDDSVALRADVRDLYTMSGGKNDVMLNMGVSFLMGGT